MKTESFDPASMLSGAGIRWRQCGRCALIAASLLAIPPTRAGETKAPGPSVVMHTYEGEFRPLDELVRVKVNSPVSLFFIDQAPVRVSANTILALPPGPHVLIAGCPRNQRKSTGHELADRISAGLEENKELPFVGKAGDLFLLGGDENGLGEMSMTMNGVKINLPNPCQADLTPVTGKDGAKAFSGAVAKQERLQVEIPFLKDADNLRDRDALQGRWRVVAINMESKDYSIEEIKQRAQVKGGDTSLVDIVMEIKGSRISLHGPKVRGETMIVDLDSHKTPKRLREISVSDGKSEQFGIYDLQGDTLRYCYGAKAPRSFDGYGRNKQMSFVLKREGTPQSPKK